MEYAVYAILILVALVACLSALAPTRVEYTESVEIAAPVEQVYDDIRMQERLMRWSAWPAETKSTCAVEGTDGVVGAKTAFFTKGKRVGHQEVVELKDNQLIRLTLVGPGPPHKPELTFELHEIAENATRVDAHFVNLLPRPFNAIWKFAGLTNWTRKLHQKDLAGLKRFAEPPHLDSIGRAVGQFPTVNNPFAHTSTT
ncbi:MAG: SRPBCC family protein [Pseudomonadota bacterium]